MNYTYLATPHLSRSLSRSSSLSQSGSMSRSLYQSRSIFKYGCAYWSWPEALSRSWSRFDSSALSWSDYRYGPRFISRSLFLPGYRITKI